MMLCMTRKKQLSSVIPDIFNRESSVFAFSFVRRITTLDPRSGSGMTGEKEPNPR